ncbi:MAG TPA: MFS transporter [Thermoplasmata archaeon]|nr:MFS transporter [Thermoplasmata archaeon]
MLVVLLFAVVFAYPRAEQTTYGALALAFLGLSSTVPTLGTAFIAGAVADRYDRGALMRTVNLASLLATAGIALDVYFAPAARVHVPGISGFYLPMWTLLLYPLWAGVTVTSTLFRPAFNTSVPRLIPTRDLGSANGLIYAVAAGASASGMLAVGVVMSFRPIVEALAIPFVLFFATQVALLVISADLSVHRTAAPRALGTEAREGFRFLYRRRALLEFTLAALAVNFLSAVATVELALYVADWLDLRVGIWYGAIVGAMTVGAAVGLLSIGRLRFERRAGRVAIALILVMGLSLLSLGLVRSVWVALPIVFVFGMVPGMLTTVFLSTVQATVPDEVMGRVFAADEMGSYALVPLGQYAGGLLTLVVGIQGTFLTAGAAIALFGVLMLVGFAALRQLSYSAPEPGPTVRGTVGEA